MEKALAELKESLEKRSPLLFVGAGFTYKSVNSKGQTIEMAKGLGKLLFDHFWGENSTYKELNECRDMAQKYVSEDHFDLKNLCQLLRIYDLVEERNSVLTSYFSGCHIDATDNRNEICDYAWRKIFTINIDCLIEDIYKSHNKEITVWNKENDDTREYIDHPTLIKLHGCINNPEAGLVFDNDEYSKFSANENYLLNEFGSSFSQNDIIFIGTEFQETDLFFIIDKYEAIGYNGGSEKRYYFVSPCINDEITKLRIQKTANMYHICMKANEFCYFLKNNVFVQNTILNKLGQYGLITSQEMYRKITSNYEYESGLYRGEDITYGDLKYNWDISPVLPGLFDWIQSDMHNKMISIHGIEYCGKTCASKRILYDFFSLGYECFEYKMNSEERIELLISYIREFENKKSIAILYEGAAYAYELLVSKMIVNNPCENRIVIITTDVEQNHLKKYHALENSNYCKTIQITERIDKERAIQVYKKLDEKHSLSRLKDYGKDMETLVSFMQEKNDIVDVLYYSSLGRGFKNHIDNIISDIDCDKLNVKFIELFCLLNRMGIIYIPSDIYSIGAKALSGTFKEQRFQIAFNKILQIENGTFHLRYSRFISDKFSDRKLSELEKINVIKSLVKYISGRFKEGEYNELSSILYKLLNLKTLCNVITYDKIKALYGWIEADCKQYSYYWVQRGLCAQKKNPPDFEEADRFLREASSIRPNSYQVAHAVAKNLIERGLDNLQNNKTDSALFDDGIQAMKSLVTDKRFSRAFGYSFHSYIDSLLKYVEITDCRISKDECMFINAIVSELNSKCNEPMISNILYKLKMYALSHNCEQYLGNVVSRFWDKTNSMNIDIEFVENDWVI